MTSFVDDEGGSLSGYAAGRPHRRLALGAVLVRALLIAALAPFAARRLPPVQPLVPAYQRALVQVRHRRRVGTGPLLKAATALVLAAVTVLASAQPKDRPFGEMLGLGVKFAQGQPLSQLPTLDELRVRWVRDLIVWPDIEPQRGNYVAFSSSFKQRLAYYRDHNIGLVALITLSNSKVYPATPTDPALPFNAQAFANFATTVAKMLKAEGVRFVIELGNEPHNSSLFKLLGGQWNGKPSSPWLDQYVRMVNAAVTAVKSYDASVRLLSQDDMWVLHYWFLEGGLPAKLDGFSVHPYVPGIPERAAIAQDTDWVKPFVAVDADRSFTSAVRRLREQGLLKLQHTPEMWITEWGWPVGTDTKQVSEDTLAGYLPRAFILAAMAGVEAMTWFSAQDTVDGPMGLSDNNLRRRESYTSFRVMAQRLGPQKLLRQVAGGGTPTSGPQGYLFQQLDASSRTLVVWNVDATARWLPLPSGESGEGAVDALGRTLTPTTLDSGQRALRFDALPIYVSGAWSDAAISAAVGGIK